MNQEKAAERKVPRAVTPAYLERAALAYLEKYASSSENLRRILLRKVEKRCRLRNEPTGSFADAVDAVVAKMVRIGLVDDGRYVQTRVASLRRRGDSSRMIRAKLAAKGLDNSSVEQALADHATDDVDAVRALMRRRRIGPFRTSGRGENRQKDIAALARAGFSYWVASMAVDGEGMGEE